MTFLRLLLIRYHCCVIKTPIENCIYLETTFDRFIGKTSFNQSQIAENMVTAEHDSAVTRHRRKTPVVCACLSIAREYLAERDAKRQRKGERALFKEMDQPNQM